MRRYECHIRISNYNLIFLATDENNLNKPSLRDSQTFSQNIKDTKSTSSTSANATSDNKKPDNSEGDDISAEEIGKILNDAAVELEKDAQKALKGLEEDKEIMKKLQEVKQRRKDSAKDNNKGTLMGDFDTNDKY